MLAQIESRVKEVAMREAVKTAHKNLFSSRFTSMKLVSSLWKDIEERKL